MAEINVVRKPAFPLWGWLVAALAILLLFILFWAFWSPGNRFNTTAGNTPPAAVNDPITDVYMVVAAPDRRALMGRQAKFANVTVQDVVGDKTFWIGPSAEQQIFVVLDEVPTPGKPGVEGRYHIRKGQTISITGTLIEMPAAETAKTLWGEPGANAAAKETVYIRANQIEIHSGGNG